ncbi:hypothetical protein HID58_045925 [Brassica napus]|uniref:Uncharacterized protein n=1 Tax=Brassica napus TaxID=3708 RepID=A0ABQ8AUZ7_BRANA|nr:hypothetical protein HID58_045925 [Brassica napus]
MQKLQDLAPTMLELWNLMDTPIEEQQEYQQITCNIAASEHEITQANSLSEDFIQYCNGRVGENLKDELENVSVQLGELRRNKAENESLLSLSFQFGDSTDYLKWFGAEETDLSLHKLEEMRRQLMSLMVVRRRA